MQRMGMIIGIKHNKIRQYKELHANVWPAVLQQLDDSHIRNYTIFLRVMVFQSQSMPSPAVSEGMA